MATHRYRILVFSEFTSLRYSNPEYTHIHLFSILITSLEYLGSTQTKPDTNHAFGSPLQAPTRRDHQYCKTVCQRSGPQMIYIG